MINKVIIQGNVVAKPELKKFQDDKEFVNFTVATNRRYKKGDEVMEEVTFHKMVAFGNKAKFIVNNFDKGSKIAIIGRLRNRQWEDKQGNSRTTTEIVVEEVDFV